MCGTIRARDAPIARACVREESRAEPPEGLISAATILAASRAVDSALATQPNRDAIESRLNHEHLSLMATGGSMASRIAQARQARQAMRAAAASTRIESLACRGGLRQILEIESFEVSFEDQAPAA